MSLKHVGCFEDDALYRKGWQHHIDCGEYDLQSGIVFGMY